MTQKEGWTYNLRFAVIFRAERKKIIHSQVRLLTYAISMLEQTFELQKLTDNLSEEEIRIEFDKIIMKKMPIELEEQDEEPYFLRRLHMRDYFREIRTVILTHKSFNEALRKKAMPQPQSQEINTTVPEIETEKKQKMS